MQENEAKPKRDTSRLVRVRRPLMRQGKPSHMTFWVEGDNVRPGDEVLENEHNVRPYKYARKEDGQPPEPYTPPKGPCTGSAHMRHTAAFFSHILKITGKE